jgi:two-component system, NarL family, response regulator NreC
MSNETKIRVLVADDHVMVRNGLKRLINDQRDMVVVAEAADGPAAVRLSESSLPDLALVDMSMPGWDGITTAQNIAAACPGVRIIAVTRHGEEPFVSRMLNAGASGYVLKQSSSSALLQAVRTVAKGGQYIDPGIRRVRVLGTPSPVPRRL